MRTIKTTLAVFFCLVMQLIFSVDQMHIFYAIIAAIVCMRETTEKSVLISVQRFIGTLIGGIIGFILINTNQYIPYYNEGMYIVILPICITLCISICALLKKQNAVVICCVVLLGIALDPTLNMNNTLWYIILRIFYTTIGIIITTLLNRYLFPNVEEEAF
ncbi:MAG: aromatic acid exporter family protein [Desulfitobacteriaceae bacterium]|nr:aromatic acid exporter family protein [Desulfitobacteriaceae bacterium]